MRTLIALVIASLLALAVIAIAQPTVPNLPFHDSLRGLTPIGEETRAPLMAPTENKDVIRGLNYAQQPPTIPHKIEGYQVDRNANRCMFCHARTKVEESRAIPVSPTHYLDRDGTVRGDLSPRRYFCTQCHVPQDEVKPLVENRYQDFDAVRAGEARRPRSGSAPATKR
jgi:cytochrome c-type protein NapB